MSRLYWSNLPDAKRPRDGTCTLWSSLTTDDLAIPEYPETSTSSGLPLATTRSQEASKVSISPTSPYNFSGIKSRSGTSYSPSANSSTRPWVSHSARQRRKSISAPAAVWYRSSAVLASSFMITAETEAGTVLNRSRGETGFLAMWQWTHSIGSDAVNG